MEHTLPPLPYSHDALAPHMSRETLEYHHDKHHNAYVTQLNNLQKGTEFESLSLEEIVKKASPGPIYNNAAQIWETLTFFWNCMKPAGGGDVPGWARWPTRSTPSGGRSRPSRKRSRSRRSAISASAGTWLVKKADGSVDIVNMGAAGTPLTTADKALFTVDVWEHAYYIDHRNLRPKFVETFLNSLANWSFAEANFA